MKSKSGSKHPILKSPVLTRLMKGNLALKSLERRFPQLLPYRAFKAELEMEMLCSDRTATPLTLLLLCPRHGLEPAGTDTLGRLAHHVCECTRKTDRKGWFQDASGIRVGLILTHTPPDRTQRIIDQIRECLCAAERAGNRQDLDLACEIYTYPPYSKSMGGPDGSHRGNGDGPGAEPGPEDGGKAGNGNGNGDGNGHGDGAAHCEAAYPPIVTLLMEPLPLWKRSFDVAASGLALLALSPLLALIAAAVKLTSPGPVIFKQPRLGYRGGIFMCWKFRSMRDGADPKAHKDYLRRLITQSSRGAEGGEEAPMIKLDKGDRQITAVGRLLRMTCLDELPQLVNVLRGEMSLVGPRPCLPYEAEQYQHWHFRRMDTVPGITGLWQVRGKNKVSFRKMIRLDILYARQRSLGLDLKILLQTIPAVLREIRDGLPAK